MLLITGAVSLLGWVSGPGQMASADGLPQEEVSALLDLPTPPPLLQRDASVVTADPIPTVQIDTGYVWAQTMIGSTVYAVGQFDNAREPMALPGVGRTPRSNVLAYDINTGALLPFAPAVNGVVKAVAAAPDGTRIYIGGTFNSVNGQARWNFAALDAATGQLVPGFTPAIGGSGVFGITAQGSTVYAGGLFTQANGTPRQNLAAFSAANGALLPWTPQTDRQIDAMVMDPAGQKVIAAGRFSQVNGNTNMRGAVALDKDTGEVDAQWALVQSVKNGKGTGTSAGLAGIFALSADDAAVYGTGWVFANASVGNLEGTFAAEADTGEVRWIADCLGDHYGVFSTGTTVYTTSHTHACSTLDLQPEQSPRKHSHVEAYTADARGLLGRNPHTGTLYQNWEGTPGPSAYSWSPDFVVGNTSGLGQQAGLSITGNSSIISVAGEFKGVNNRQFEGIVRFSTAPPGGANEGPRLSGSAWVPSGTSVVPGRVRISIPANYDRDDLLLTYELRRAGVSEPVTVSTHRSTWWDRSSLILEDLTAVPGAQHTYSVVARDGDGNTTTSVAVGVAVADGAASEYVMTVLNDGAQHYYPLGISNQDWASGNNGIVGGGVTAGSPGIAKSSTGHSNFNGAASGRFASGARTAAPPQFSAEVWFRTTTNRGGKILGYGDSSSSNSNSYDRHIYMLNDGRLTFGVYPGSAQTITSPTSYNDGQWHHAVATQGSDGIRLHVDGQQVAENLAVTSAQGYLGHWRIGGDNLNGWPNRPISDFFSGSIDEVAIYPYVLDEHRISTHFGVGMGFQAPIASFEITADELLVSFDASGSSAHGTATLQEFQWDFGDGTTGAGDSTTHAYPATGTYQVSLTVIDSNGLSNVAELDVDVLGPNQPPQAEFDHAISGLTVDVDASDSSDADGTIESYVWDWGDGTPTNHGVTASHRYAAPGTFTIELAVADDRGGSSLASRDITVVHADPVASFIGHSSGLEISVDASESTAFNGATLTYAWDWGDGQTGTGQTATHTYDQGGEYTVKLTLSDSLGGANQGTQTFFVSAIQHLAVDTFDRIVAAGWGAADEGGVWALRSGSASLTSVNDGEGRLHLPGGSTREMVLPDTTFTDGLVRVSYRLSGGPDTGDTYVGIGTRYSHANSYRAQVWHRANGSMWLIIERNGAAIATLPLGGVTWTSNSAFHLTTELSGTSPTTIKAKVWPVGDDEPDWQLQATDSATALQSPGAVSLRQYRAGGAGGANDVAFDNFSVRDLVAVEEPSNEPPVASFEFSVAGLSVAVDGSDSLDPDGSVTSYAWDFGDGASATGVDAVHTYGSSGNYEVTLTVTDDAGEVDQLTREVTVTEPPEGNEPPAAAFEFSVSALDVTLDGAGSSDPDGSIASYQWDLGDGASASGVTASHTYATAGTYQVTLTVTDDAGASHSLTQSINVEDPGSEEPPENQTILLDEFERTVSRGWGTADMGGDWSLTGGAIGTASVSDGQGFIDLAPGSTRTAVLTSSSVGESLTEIDFSIDQNADAGAGYIGVTPRRAGGQYYLMQAWLRPDGTVWLVAQRGSSVLSATSVSGMTYEAGEKFTLKVELTDTVDGSQLRGKIWKVGSVEPSGWQVSATDTTAALQGMGEFGIRASRTSASTQATVVAVDRISVMTIT